MARGARVRLGSMLLVLSLLAAACGPDTGRDRPRAGIPTPGVTQTANTTETPDLDPPPTPTHEDEPSPAASETRDPKPTISVEDPCAAFSLTGGGGSTQFAVEPPANSTLKRADSWVAIGSFWELAWVSHWIVQTRVVGCDEGLMGFVDYTVEVEHAYRGEPRPSFTLLPSRASPSSADGSTPATATGRTSATSPSALSGRMSHSLTPPSGATARPASPSHGCTPGS